MKKFTILAGLMALALFIGVAGTSLRAGSAQADPTDVIAFNPDVCASVVVADLIDQTDSSSTTSDNTVANATKEATADCYGAGLAANPAILNRLALILDGDGLQDLSVGAVSTVGNTAVATDPVGNVDDPDTYSVLVDYSAAQLGATGTAVPGGQALWVLTMVTNDAAVHLDAEEGVWLSTSPAPYASQTDCNAAVASWFGGVEADCDGSSATVGDGVVVDMLFGDTSGADVGDTATITADQAGEFADMDVTVVGAPDDITLKATKETLQQDAADADCDLLAFTTAIAKPQIAGLLAEVVDEDGTALTGIHVDWDSSDDDVVHFALVQNGVDEGDEILGTVSLSSNGQISAPNLGCAGDTGTSTIDATVMTFSTTVVPPALVDTNIDDEIDLTVVGAPASMTLAANPTTIACNGTNSSEVSATVLDSAGNPVVAGNKVRFEVVALGTANPIVATTDDKGVAKSTITPLSGVTAGVTVLVSIVDDDTIEQNILVSCTPAVPIVVPTVAPPVVTPPITGDGGYLP
jgi:adhesin/invasin